jgi:cytochrome b561
MSHPHRRGAAEIAQELGLYVIALSTWRMTWRLRGEVVLAPQKEPEGWGPAYTFTVVL